MINIVKLNKINLNNDNIFNIKYKYNNKYLKQKIQILKGNEVYRIGDTINNTLKKNVVEEIINNKIYKNSILERYYRIKNINNNKNKNIRYNNLYNSMMEYLKEKNKEG